MVAKKVRVAINKNKVTKREIAQTLEGTVQWLIFKFGISKSSKKVRKVTKTFTQSLAAELKYLAERDRKKNKIRNGAGN